MSRWSPFIYLPHSCISTSGFLKASGLQTGMEEKRLWNPPNLDLASVRALISQMILSTLLTSHTSVLPRFENKPRPPYTKYWASSQHSAMVTWWQPALRFPATPTTPSPQRRPQEIDYFTHGGKESVLFCFVQDVSFLPGVKMGWQSWGNRED